MCNLYQHKSQFIEMKFYPKIWTEKKHGVHVSVVYLYLHVGIESSVHWDKIIQEHFILLQAKHRKTLVFHATETILNCSKCRSAVEPCSYAYSHSHAHPPNSSYLSLKLLQIFEIPGEIHLHLHPLVDALKEYLMRKYCVVYVIGNGMLSFL